MGIFGWSLPPGCGTLPGEEAGAVEKKIDGVWYAWDENDCVYRHDPKHPDAREDGYVYIGVLILPNDWDNEADPMKLLREFVKGESNGIRI